MESATAALLLFSLLHLLDLPAEGGSELLFFFESFLKPKSRLTYTVVLFCWAFRDSLSVVHISARTREVTN